MTEALQLRVRHLDVEHQSIIVRKRKVCKDRVVMLPQSVVPSLREQLGRARALRAADQARVRAGVAMPDAPERKYPRAGSAWTWFWVFLQGTHLTDSRSGVVRRHCESATLAETKAAQVRIGTNSSRLRRSLFVYSAGSKVRRAAESPGALNRACGSTWR